MFSFCKLAENINQFAYFWSKPTELLDFVPFVSSLFFGRHFAQWEVDEEKVVESWISHMDTDRDVRELGAVKK